jgi:hypothetical protein
VSETNGPRFLLICEDAGDCTARYCFERARYWAIWNRTMNITRSELIVKKAVCLTHRDTIKGRHWDEVSGDFRTSWESKART